MKMVRMLLTVGLALGLVAVVLPVSAQTAGLARLRVTHLSNDVSSVDVYLNGEVILQGVPFASVSDYVTLEAGTHNIAVAPAGTSADQALADPLTLNFQPDTSYVVADMGSQATDQGLTLLAVDELQAIDPTQASVIAVHGVSDAGAVDLVVESSNPTDTSASDSGATDMGTTLISGLQYDNFAAFSVAPGQYAMDVTASGDQSNVLFSDLNPITFEAGRLYLIGLGGTIGQGTDLALEETPTGGLTPMVRFAHFGSDAPAVDVFVDGQPFLSGLAFTDISAYQALAEGSHEVMFAPAGEGMDAPMGAPLTLSLAGDHHYLVTATGRAADSTFGAMSIDETATFMDLTGDVQILMLNGISDGGPLDVILAGDQNTALASGLAFNNFAAQSFAAGEYPILITASGDPSNVWFSDLNPTTLDANTLYLVAAVGSAADPTLVVDSVPLNRASNTMTDNTESTEGMSTSEDMSATGGSPTLEPTPAS